MISVTQMAKDVVEGWRRDSGGVNKLWQRIAVALGNYGDEEWSRGYDDALRDCRRAVAKGEELQEPEDEEDE